MTAGTVRPPSGLYVHVPFCVSHCPYCDFVVVAGRDARGPRNRIAAFVAAVRAELNLRADVLDGTWPARPPLQSLYLGGGTPSLLPADELAGLIDLVRRRFGLEPGAEVTLEVNPGPDERGDAGLQRAGGVTRLSIGAQSLDDAELRRLGRRHRASDVAETLRLARAAGIRSVSMDLLYDLPAQSMATWAATLDAAVALEPDHLSLYALSLDDPDAEGLTGVTGDHLPLRAGARRWRDSARGGQDEDRAADQYEAADRRLRDAGFDWYEISNWARPGHESRHNLGYWRGAAWEAAGPGAHAFDGRVRRWNASRLDGYLAALVPAGGSEPRLPPGGLADEGDAADEGISGRAMLSLRTRAGLPVDALEDPSLRGGLGWGLEHGLLEVAPDGGALRLSLRGRLLSNELFERLA